MIIGFDVNSIYGTLTGVGNYSLNLINTLRKINKDDIFKFYSYSVKKKKQTKKIGN